MFNDTLSSSLHCTYKKWRYCTFVPPRVRVRATVKLSAAFFHDESSITIGGGGVQKCNSAQKMIYLATHLQIRKGGRYLT